MYGWIQAQLASMHQQTAMKYHMIIDIGAKIEATQTLHLHGPALSSISHDHQNGSRQWKISVFMLILQKEQMLEEEKEAARKGLTAKLRAMQDEQLEELKQRILAEK